jgi:hypothetical protein
LYEAKGYHDNDQVDPEHSNITLKQLKQICSMPLWWTDKEVHLKLAKQHPDACCFHHFLGLEEKHGEIKVPHPGLIDCINRWNNNKASVTWKFGGMAFTTTGEYYLPHLAIASEDVSIRNSKMAIIVGPRTKLATDMLDSMREKFRRKQGIEFYGNMKEVQFPPPNHVNLEIFPSNVHISAIRGAKNMSRIWFDECDHISKEQIRQMLDAMERYLLKSRCKLILGSTPNRADHMLDRISKEYGHLYEIKKYTVYDCGIPWCYTQEEVDEASHWPSFQREFMCQFLGNEGNVFARAWIDNAFNMGLQACKLDPHIAHYYPDHVESKDLEDIAVMQYLDRSYCMPIFPKGLGADPAHGSSDYAIVITAVKEGFIDVIYAKKFRRSSPAAMTKLIKDLATIYRGSKIHIDGNNAGAVTDLKIEFHEDNKENKYDNLTTFRDPEIQRHMVVPVNFRSMRKMLLQHAVRLVSRGRVRIHPIFRDLRIAMESATATDFDLDKEVSTYDDLTDSLCLSLLSHSLGVKKGYMSSLS